MGDIGGMMGLGGGAQEIRADYPSLNEVAKIFATEADEIGKQTQQIRQHVDQLRGGGWKSEGATRFYNEMDSLVFPGLKRLQAALQQGAKVAQDLAQLMQQAEQEAGSLFNN